MRVRVVLAALPLLLQGCVMGYGYCLWTGPVKHTFTGTVHYREYPDASGIDTVPVLVLDGTDYIYLPAQSTHCLSANELQLTGLAELPRDVVENTHVVVEGKVFAATQPHQHTALLVDVTSVLPLRVKPPENEAADKK